MRISHRDDSCPIFVHRVTRSVVTLGCCTWPGFLLIIAFMSYEVERKYRVEDPGAVEERIRALGGTLAETVDQSDTYLSHPARDFAVTNEALRVRVENDRAWITYKGPRLASAVKTREEIEVELAQGAAALAPMITIWLRLGFQEVAVVRKQRRVYPLDWNGRKMICAIDQVEDLGGFVEVEMIAETKDDLDQARRAVVDLATELGLKSYIRRSYLRMVLALKNRPSVDRMNR